MRAAAGLKRISVFVLATAVALCAAEWTLRALRPESLETALLSLYRTDSNTGFSLNPGFTAHLPDGSNVVINDLGLRDSPMTRSKPAGTIRILCLGDSFVFGLGVDAKDSFPERCEVILRESMGGDVEVVNCGVPAWGTDESRRFFLSNVGALKPDAVVLSIFVGNDTFDDLASDEFTVENGLLVPADRSSPLPWDRSLANSALWTLMKRIGNDLTETDKAPVVTTGGAKRRSMAEMLEVYRKIEISDSGARRGRDAITANVEMIRKTSNALGIRFGVLLIPALVEVDDAAFAQVLAREKLSPMDFDSSVAATRLAYRFGELGVPFLDLAPAFRDATQGDGRKLYLRNYHFNPTGHAIAGRRLSIFLRDVLEIGR